MNDDNNPDLQALSETALEARLVAVVLGEASAFERAELERVIAQRPEFAVFQRRIEAVHSSRNCFVTTVIVGPLAEARFEAERKLSSAKPIDDRHTSRRG